ncbi:type I secretion protein [Ruegeria phage vB_RpoS-V10]|nr:hypothetical protein DSS3P8_119 [Roseobacter phage DSS3P8]AWY09242.1 type I secretion protein [Ruegeria phage vB_RpoS-V10]
MSDKHQNTKGKGHDSHGNGHGYGHDDCDVPCFAEGTLLRMQDGSWKAVEHIQVGDTLHTHLGSSASVLWAGSSIEKESMFMVHTTNHGAAITVTGNHGIVVRLMDGRRVLAPAKFLTESLYGEFLVTEVPGEMTVHHIMLENHNLVESYGGIISESYYCGGYKTVPAAMEAYYAATGHRTMALTLPRLRRRDAAEISEIIMEGEYA